MVDLNEDGTYKLEEVQKAPMIFIPIQQGLPQYERVVLLKLKEKYNFSEFIDNCKYSMAYYTVSGGIYSPVHGFFSDGEGNHWEIDEVDSWMYIEHLDKISSQEEIKITVNKEGGLKTMSYYKQYEDVDRIPNDLTVGDAVSLLRMGKNECRIFHISEIKNGWYTLKDISNTKFRRKELCKMIYQDGVQGFTGYAMYYRFLKTGENCSLCSTAHSVWCAYSGCYDHWGNKIFGPGPKKIKVDPEPTEAYIIMLKNSKEEDILCHDIQ